MKKIIPFFLVLFVLTACQKDPDLSDLDNDFVVYTDHDSKSDFKSFNTFYIPDSVLVIGKSEQPRYWTDGEADDVTSVIINNMESRGYTRVMDKEKADVGLQVSFVEDVTHFTNWSFNNYWWWGYPGYWSPSYWFTGWGPNWGMNWNDWYYPYPVVYSYSIGSLLTEMVNLKGTVVQEQGEKRVPVVWTAYMAGLLSGSNKIDNQLAVRAIEQAFVQSPYIRK